MSQCETEEPPSNGLGANSNARPALSVPEGTAVSASNVALTGAPSWALIKLPSLLAIDSEGIVTVLSEPPICTTPGDVVLTIITPTAPAFCAFFTFNTNVQLPRSMSAILPDIAALFVSGVQPSMGEACVTFAVTPGNDSGAPKAAVPTV